MEAGYKEITLLGQNVNSYGKGLAAPAVAAVVQYARAAIAPIVRWIGGRD